MKMARNRSILLMIVMLGAVIATIVLKPTRKIADQGPAINLQSMIPTQFGDWVQEDNSNIIVDPRQNTVINKIYSQTLMRTYKNAQGYRIMLSLAYGGDQTDTMEVHKPEICYPAQGFILHDKNQGVLNLAENAIPITRIHTSMGLRVEPVTYWTTVGNHVVNGNINKKIIELRYGLVGEIPDGILVRLSSIDDDVKNAYDHQNTFALDMIASLDPMARMRLTGSPQLP